jgi:hypothetical protein
MLSVYRVTDCDSVPVNARINGRKNMYFSRAHAQSAATQFNNVQIFKHGESTHLDGFPFKVESGKVNWDA